MMGSAPRPNPDDREAAMARADLYKLANYSMKLFKMIQDGDQLEGWVQAKITKSADYIASVYHFMEYEMKFSEYGERLETADMYSESVKREYKRKLTEAKVKLDKLKEKNIADLDEGWEDMMAANKKAASEKGTGKFDVKKTSTGTQYTRKSSTFDDGGKDSDTKKAEKKTKKVKESGIFRAGMPVPQDIDGGSAPAPIKRPAAMSKPAPKVLDLEAAKRDPRYMKDPKFRAEVDRAEAFAKSFSAGSMKEALKGGQKKLDVDKDGKLEKSDFEKLRASKGVKEAKSEKFDPLKHVKNPTKGEKDAAKDVKRGSYADRAAMLKSAEKDGRLKEGSKPDFLDMDKDGDKKEPMKKAVADKKVKEAAKPDFLDMDKDGNKKEPMKKAVADKKKNPFAKK